MSKIKWDKSAKYHPADILPAYPSIKVVAEVANKDYGVTLFHIPEENIYLEQGPWGYHESMIMRLADIEDAGGVEEWLAKFKAGLKS